MKKIKILEISSEDIIGKRFNGYDICNYYENSDIFDVKQLVLFKQSKNKNVVTFTDSVKTNYILKLSELEETILSTKGQLSLSSNFLYNNICYQKCDIVHFHMYHNTLLSIYDLIKISKEKKIIISLHDPWWLSGRCVHSYECDKWIKGCYKCEYLFTMFPMKFDNTKSLWNLKKNVLNKIDATYLYPSKYIEKLIKISDILKEEKKVFLPFGIDTDFFSPKNKKMLRNKYGIKDDEIVISFRAQNEFKGTKYILEALKKIKTNVKIKIFTIDQKNSLKKLANKFDIIDLGIISSDELVNIYNISDMFLSPSIGETFGFMPVEALSCETPVIVFNNTSLPSITFAPDVGLVANNLDSKDLMEKIEYLINHSEERIKRGKLGRKMVIKNYSLKKYYEKLQKIYINKFNEKSVVSNYMYSKLKPKDKKVLKRKLKIIYKNLFGEKCTNNLLKGSSKNIFDKKHVIDYSNIEIQEILKEFNNIIFKKALMINEEKRNSVRTFLILLIYDRKKLISTVKEKLRRKKL